MQVLPLWRKFNSGMEFFFFFLGYYVELILCLVFVIGVLIMVSWASVSDVWSFWFCSFFFLNLWAHACCNSQYCEGLRPLRKTNRLWRVELRQTKSLSNYEGPKEGSVRLCYQLTNPALNFYFGPQLQLWAKKPEIIWLQLGWA